MRLQGKVAIVTGGAQGIGREYCLRFAGEGAAVVVADLRTEQAQALAAEIESSGGRALALETDVADEASVDRMAQMGGRPLRRDRRAGQQRRDLLRPRRP